jgi:hypothetical protein
MIYKVYVVTLISENVGLTMLLELLNELKTA